MQLIKKENSIFLMDNNNEIEEYNFDTEINFSKYIEFLLSKNLSEQVEIENSIENPTEAEENLIKIINSIKNDYNSKVEELKKYIEEQEKK